MNYKAKAAVPRWMICLAAAAVASTCLANMALAKPEKQVAPDPGRTTPVHNIPLFNAEGAPIDPSAKDAKPMSQKVSCGKCHDYEIIERGWHFNTGDANVPPGRCGQAWVLADMATGTQIPISPRGWKGSYKPAQIGMSSWMYVDKFGRQMPGGDYGERFADKFGDPTTDRWGATGNLSINCLGCHSCDSRQNQDEWAKNIERGNYLEAGTAASGFGHVLGYVNKLPETFDRILGEAPDAPQFVPAVIFDKTRFGYKDSAFVDIAAAKLPNNRCYYCHSTHRVDKQEFETQEDVHMARGLSCVACHRNGINHEISRNYEGETHRAEGYSCRGCHLGQSEAMTAELRKGGFGAAPRPAHKGIPQLHLDKLTCTACHSGAMPSAEPKRIQTARIHALNVHGIPYDPNMLPLVLEPVFVKQDDGKIAPCRMVFPAFFGRVQVKDGKVKPMLPAAVIEATGGLLATPAGKAPAAPTPEKIAAALKALGTDKNAGLAVYVGGGKLWKLDGDKPVPSDDPAAEPYAWPVAHDVRPASQSLGADGACTDCHSADSAFLFGKVPPITPVALGEPAPIEMNRFTGMDPTYYKLFGLTFIFRPYLKSFGFAVSGIVLLVILAFGLQGFASVLKRRCGRAR
jgi:hypothetical protein